MKIKHCQRCKGTEGAMHINSKYISKKTGKVIEKYMCAECSAERHNNWYHKSLKNKDKQRNWNRNQPNVKKYEAQMRWLAKTLGYTVTKNENEKES